MFYVCEKEFEGRFNLPTQYRLWIDNKQCAFINFQICLYTGTVHEIDSSRGDIVFIIFLTCNFFDFLLYYRFFLYFVIYFSKFSMYFFLSMYSLVALLSWRRSLIFLLNLLYLILYFSFSILVSCSWRTRVLSVSRAVGLLGYLCIIRKWLRFLSRLLLLHS